MSSSTLNQLSASCLKYGSLKWASQVRLICNYTRAHTHTWRERKNKKGVQHPLNIFFKVKWAPNFLRWTEMWLACRGQCGSVMSLSLWDWMGPVDENRSSPCIFHRFPYIPEGLCLLYCCDTHTVFEVSQCYWLDELLWTTQSQPLRQ